MKGDIEKIEQENEFLYKLAEEQKNKLEKICNLLDAQEKLKKEMENNRKCLLLWQTKKRFGIKECKSEKEAWNFIKEYSVIYYNIIDGYIFTGNWKINTAYERK